MAEPSFLQRLMTETWPAKMATGALQALMLPGDVYAGRVDPMSQNRIHPMNNRPILQNGDGSIATEESVTVTHPLLNGGKPTNIPSIWGGQRPPHKFGTQEFEDWAVDRALGSGQNFGSFASIAEAVAAAKERSEKLGSASGMWSDEDESRAQLTQGAMMGRSP